MRIDQYRLFSSTEARSTLPAILDAAGEGRTSHVIRDRTVAAHIVPPDALVVTNDVEPAIRVAVVSEKAAWLVTEAERNGYRNAGDSLGKVLAWTWESRPDTAVRWFASYALALFDLLEARRIARPAFDTLWWAVNVALRGFLLDGAISDFERTIRERLADLGYDNVFTAAELAGRGRERGIDDPWPDTESFGLGWAKKRWRDIDVGDFVPDPQLQYEFGSVDDWCRVLSTDGALRRMDGGETHLSIDENSWVPFRAQGPWHWPAGQ